MKHALAIKVVMTFFAIVFFVIIFIDMVGSVERERDRKSAVLLDMMSAS